MSRCRICFANDQTTLVEDVARAMWETQRSSSPDDEWRPWDQAGQYWQHHMRVFAAATIATLRRARSA